MINRNRNAHLSESECRGAWGGWGREVGGGEGIRYLGVGGAVRNKVTYAAPFKFLPHVIYSSTPSMKTMGGHLPATQAPAHSACPTQVSSQLSVCPARASLVLPWQPRNALQGARVAGNCIVYSAFSSFVSRILRTKFDFR